MGAIDNEGSLLLHARSFNERPVAAFKLMSDVLKLVATCVDRTPGIVLKGYYCHSKSLEKYSYEGMATASLQSILHARSSNALTVVASCNAVKTSIALCELLGLSEDGLMKGPFEEN